ncbi:ankyrin repeat domain-containing protein [Pseudocitrobacter corydidari]
MLLKLIMLFSMFFIPLLAGCSMFDDVFEKNYSLSSVASFPDDVDELKKIWFFCERCLSDEQCENHDIKQCRDVTIPSRDEALSKAVGRANVEAVYFLVDVAKTDVNGITGKYKETPLIIAAYYGTQVHQDIAEFLLLHGADINKTYPAIGRNPLGVARWKHNVDFVNFLLKHGAEPAVHMVSIENKE